jgi:hypothetical protein
MWQGIKSLFVCVSVLELVSRLSWSKAALVCSCRHVGKDCCMHWRWNADTRTVDLVCLQNLQCTSQRLAGSQITTAGSSATLLKQALSLDCG